MLTSRQASPCLVVNIKFFSAGIAFAPEQSRHLNSLTQWNGWLEMSCILAPFLPLFCFPEPWKVVAEVMASTALPVGRTVTPTHPGHGSRAYPSLPL